MALPVDVRDLMKTGTRFSEERALPVRIAVLVEVDADDTLIDAVREQLHPFTSSASLQVEVAELGKPPALAQTTDAVIALAGSGNVGLREALSVPRRLRLPVVVASIGDNAVETRLSRSLQQPTVDLIVSEDAERAVQRVGAWLADNLGSKRLALAHNFAFIRRAVAEDAVKTTAVQNALIGAVTPIPGADMPIMTANQIKMLLQIAAAYGQTMGVDRVKELAAVVAGGYVLRAVARQALVAIPVLGWAVKGGIGYTGTMAMGRAAVSYFEKGADLGEVTAYFRSIRDKAVKRGPRHRGTALPPTEVATLPPADVAVLPPVDVAVPAAGAQQVLPIAEDDPARA